MNSPGQHEMLKALYKKAFPVIAAWVSRRGGSFDDAKDVFQEALIIFYEKKAASENFCHDEKAYLFGIAKHLWLRKVQSDKMFSPVDEELSDLQDDASPSEIKLLRVLESAGKKCLELLRAFYYEKQPLKQVASAFGYSGERSATVQKYKCLEKVRDTVKQKSLRYADFLESD